MKKLSIVLSAALLSMSLFSQILHAEGIATASRHALAPIAPEGKWIIQMEARNLSYNSMYDNDGKNRALGSDYNAIALDAAVFPLLALFPAGSSLGTTSLSAKTSIRRGQITMGYGLTENLTVGVISSFGQNKTSVNFSVAGGDVGWNPLYNPAVPVGIANIPFAPVGGGAAQAMTTADINNILSNPAFGYEYQPIQDTTVTDMGTVILGALWRFYEGEHDSLVAGFGVRKSFAGENDPDNLFDVPLDDGSTDIIAQVEYYRQIASVFDVRLMVKRTFQMSDQVTSRVIVPGGVLALASSKEVLDRNMGDFWEYDIELGASYENWRISGTWHRYLKKADHFYSARGQDVSSLIRNTAHRADQWRVAISWSGVDAWMQKKIAMPVIVKLEMQDTVRGRNMGDLRDYYLIMTTFF